MTQKNKSIIEEEELTNNNNEETAEEKRKSIVEKIISRSAVQVAVEENIDTLMVDAVVPSDNSKKGKNQKKKKNKKKKKGKEKSISSSDVTNISSSTDTTARKSTIVNLEGKQSVSTMGTRKSVNIIVEPSTGNLIDDDKSIVSIKQALSSALMKFHRSSSVQSTGSVRAKSSDSSSSSTDEDHTYFELAKRMQSERRVTVIEEEPKKKKKKKKKKKAEPKEEAEPENRMKMLQMMERQRLLQEEEAARLAEEERKRVEEEKRLALEKFKRESFEQYIRNDQLYDTCNYIDSVDEFIAQIESVENEQCEWEEFLKCRKLPNPSLTNNMNTYLHRWHEEIDNKQTIEQVSEKTKDCLELLDELEELIVTKEDIQDEQTIENWKWVRSLFRDTLSKSIDSITYRLLRDIEKNLRRIDIPTADYRYKDNHFVFCLWLRVQLPIPFPNHRRPPKPQIIIKFPEMKMTVEFPPVIDCDCKAIRAMYFKFDHLSDSSPAFYLPNPLPKDILNLNFYKTMRKEWFDKLLYKFNNRDLHESKKKEEKIEENPEDENLPEEMEPSITGTETTAAAGDEVSTDVKRPKDEYDVDEFLNIPYKKLEPSASEYVLNEENEFYIGIEQTYKKLPDHVINLRKYTLIGGLYILNYFHQPPQPQDFVTMEMEITKLLLPKQLEEAKFCMKYIPPPEPEPSATRLPEDIEAEIKLQEEEFKKLITVNLTWPDHVMYLDLPIVCQWNPKKKVWSKKYVYDLKHNEEQFTLTFRTGKFGIFGLAVNKFANLPYQSWEMRPESDGTITLQVTGAVLNLEFNIKNNMICLNLLQNAPNRVFQRQLGEYFKLSKLIRTLRSIGVDFFPEMDAIQYLDSIAQGKHWPLERHLYYLMAQMGLVFNFAWSRWNQMVERRCIIFQMREYSLDKAKQKPYSMTYVTPLKATFINCTELDQALNEEPLENMKFCSDLYYLMKATTTMTVKAFIDSTPKDLVHTTAHLMMALRLFSFS